MFSLFGIITGFPHFIENAEEHYSYFHSKTPLTKRQLKVRARNKAAHKSRMRNRRK